MNDPRNLLQNARFHAICNEVARQCMFRGRWLSGQQWKVLFVSAHAIATQQEDPDIVRGLEGEYVALRESTAAMSSERMASLIEYCSAWSAQMGIHLAK